ncbi:hypothetical protein Ddc_14836 [Ditylenchus destructor]|nr:hypothetical protein Ddc_14836 [Ditylenchus destructor]
MPKRNNNKMIDYKANAQEDLTRLTAYMEKFGIEEYWVPGQYVLCRKYSEAEIYNYAEAQITGLTLYEDKPAYHVHFPGQRTFKVFHSDAIAGDFRKLTKKAVRQIEEKKAKEKEELYNTMTRSQRGGRSKKICKQISKQNRKRVKPDTNMQYEDYGTSNWNESMPLDPLDDLMSGMELSDDRSFSPNLPAVVPSLPEKRNITIDEAERALANGTYTPKGLWYGLLPNFTRKQLFKLQLSSRAFVEEVESLDLSACHVIDNLHFKKGEQDDEYGLKMFSVRPSEYIPGAVWRQQIKDFRPPDYVRFSEVYFHTFVINADFMEHLKKYKENFTGCSFWMMPTDLNEEAGETLKFLMENIFTACKDVRFNLADGWQSADQLDFLAQSMALPGVARCNEVTLSTHENSLDETHPLHAPILQWLHSDAGNEKRIMSLKGFTGWPNLIYKAMLNFASDREPHFYLLYLSEIEVNSLGGRKYYYQYNTYTREQLRLYQLENTEGGGHMFCMARMPSGASVGSL